jgi:hypothetical protein
MLQRFQPKDEWLHVPVPVVKQNIFGVEKVVQAAYLTEATKQRENA